MDEKEFEALKAELEELKSGMDALKAKNNELIAEKRKLQAKNGDSVEMAKYEEALTELDRVKAEYAKLEKQSKTNFEQLTASLKDKETALSKLVIDDGLNAALIKAGVKSDVLETVKKALRGDVILKDNAAYIGDKPLDEYITNDWATTAGQFFIQAPNNIGGGANGGKGGGGTDNKVLSLEEQYKQLGFN